MEFLDGYLNTIFGWVKPDLPQFFFYVDIARRVLQAEPKFIDFSHAALAEEDEAGWENDGAAMEMGMWYLVWLGAMEIHENLGLQMENPMEFSWKSYINGGL